jgi:hypothetical protein
MIISNSANQYPQYQSLNNNLDDNLEDLNIDSLIDQLETDADSSISDEDLDLFDLVDNLATHEEHVTDLVNSIRSKSLFFFDPTFSENPHHTFTHLSGFVPSSSKVISNLLQQKAFFFISGDKGEEEIAVHDQWKEAFANHNISEITLDYGDGNKEVIKKDKFLVRSLNTREYFLISRIIKNVIQVQSQLKGIKIQKEEDFTKKSEKHHHASYLHADIRQKKVNENIIVPVKSKSKLHNKKAIIKKAFEELKMIDTRNYKVSKEEKQTKLLLEKDIQILDTNVKKEWLKNQLKKRGLIMSSITLNSVIGKDFMLIPNTEETRRVDQSTVLKTRAFARRLNDHQVECKLEIIQIKDIGNDQIEVQRSTQVNLITQESTDKKAVESLGKMVAELPKILKKSSIRK